MPLRMHTPSKAEAAATAFVTLAAHQLKTPIAELRGYIENLSSGAAGKLTDMQLEYLSQMEAVCGRTAHLINNLLDISQIEQGVITMNLTPTELRSIANDAVDTFEHDITAKGLALRIEEAEPNIIVFADPQRTGEVLKNLISNAVKFTDKGAITITLGKAGKYGTITVADTGSGMSDEARASLFQRKSVLGKPFMSGQGAGLGLYVAHQFALFENGTINLLPSDAGAVFQTKLPLFTAKTPLGKKVRPFGLRPAKL